MALERWKQEESWGKRRRDTRIYSSVRVLRLKYLKAHRYRCSVGQWIQGLGCAESFRIGGSQPPLVDIEST